MQRFLATAGAAGLSATAGATDAPPESAGLDSEFMPFVELAPMEVTSESLSLSIYARSPSDRRYAERFAESVIRVAYESLGKSTGHGLVIVGDRGEPHPFFVFRRFVTLAREKQLEGTVAESTAELENLLTDWEGKVRFDGGPGSGMELEFDAIVPAFPIPLEGMASTLYQIAWTEKFDETRVSQRLASLGAAELESDGLSRYDWVFYLPPRSTLDVILREVIPKFMEEKELGFFQRMAMRGAIFTFKPFMVGAFEGLRRGMLFLSILRAVSDYDQADIESLTGAYMAAMMPKGPFSGNKHGGALAAIEAQKVENAEMARNPFVSPEPLEEFDLDSYKIFEGEYGNGKRSTHRFMLRDDTVTWQYLDWDPGVFLPAGDNLFVSEDGKMTIEFHVDDEGVVTGVEERWVRRRNWVPRR